MNSESADSEASFNDRRKCEGNKIFRSDIPRVSSKRIKIILVVHRSTLWNDDEDDFHPTFLRHKIIEFISPSLSAEQKLCTIWEVKLCNSFFMIASAFEKVERNFEQWFMLWMENICIASLE